MATESSLRHAIGVDFGGTFIKMALVSEKGDIIASETIPTSEASTRDAWMDAVETGLEKLSADAPFDRSEISGIGVGVPGFVDYERGYLYELANVPGWNGVPLASLMEERFAMRVRVDNDVNAMALGECTFGAGRVYSHAVFVTLGTGVGGGILINNQLYRGAYSMAGEVGHMTIE